ncbi:MAG: glycosyltransferase [Pseudomonadota bacterium]
MLTPARTRVFHTRYHMRVLQVLERLCEDWLPNVVHAHSPAQCGMAPLRVARRQNIPLVYQIRAFWEDAAVGNGTGRTGSLTYRLTRALENRVAAGVDKIGTICAGLSGDLLARGVPAERTMLSRGGVDLTLLGERLAADPGLAARLGIGPPGDQLMPRSTSSSICAKRLA